MQKEKGNEKIKFVTYYYAIATIIIVLVHSRMMHTDNPNSIRAVVHFLSCFHMPAFFFIAGVLLVYTEHKHDSIIKWWKEKCLKLWIPYVMLTLLAYLPKCIFYSVLGKEMEFSLFFLLKTFLIPQQSIWGHFWFIPVYSVMMLGAFYIYRYVKNNTIRKVIIVASIILNIVPIKVQWLGISDITYEAFYLILGMILSEKVIEYSKKDITIVHVVRMLIICVAMLIVTMLTEITLIRRIVGVVGIYTYIVLSIFLARKDYVSLNIIGRYNFNIYIYSWPFQAIIEIVFLLHIGMNVYLVWLFKFVCGIFLPLICVYIYYKTKLIHKNSFMDKLVGV